MVSEMNVSRRLSLFSKNIYSQFGEDGIIEEVLRRFQTNGILCDFTCVEFGAWDGVYLSNTCNLILNHHYKAVLIEADSKKSSEISANFKNQDVTVINRRVGTSAQDSLDSILAKTGISPNFDFLSIDVDGMDYHILASLEKFRPKIICVEFNSSIPNEVEFVQASDPRINQGSSPLSINLLAITMGYKLVAATYCNLIFVKKEYLQFAISFQKEPDLSELRDDAESKNYVFFGYDGQIITQKPLFTSWHQVVVSSRRIQGIPRIFRKFPSNFGSFRNWLWSRYIGIKNRPGSYPKVL